MPPRTRRQRSLSEAAARKATAATTIQQYWKKRFVHMSTKKLVTNMVERQKVTSDYVKSISFESLVVFLREKKVISATKAALQRIHMKVTFLHGSPPRALAPQNVNVRVFLAAFMIAHRPTHVFEAMGQLEQALFESACAMLSCFKQVCDAIMLSANDSLCFGQKMNQEISKNFGLFLFEYLQRFKAWKVPDEAKLCCRIRHALLALYQARQHVDETEVRLQTEFQEQITRLRGKLVQIAGPEALQKLDDDIANGAAFVENPVTGGSSSTSTLPGRMTNEELAHALLLDISFQLPEDGYDCGNGRDMIVFRRMRETFHKAFWESLTDDLKLMVPCYVRVLRVLKEVQEGVNEMNNRSGIEEIIDMDLIKQRTDNGTYTAQDGMNLVVTTTRIMLDMQGASRKAQTEERFAALQATIGAAAPDKWAEMLVKGLEFLMDRLNAMRIDAANARLRLIAPVIRDHGIDYETGKFRDKVRDRSIVPTRTMEWIATTLGTVVQLGSQIREMSSSARIDLHARAMMSLIHKKEEEVVNETTVPETLMFDAQRINGFRHEFNFLIKAKTFVVLMGMERLPGAPAPKSIQEMTKEKAEAKERVDATMAILDNMEEHETFDHTKFMVPLQFETIVRNELEATEGPVRALMRLQLQKEIKTRIIDLNHQRPPTFFPNTGGINGMSSLYSRTEVLVNQFSKVAKLNRSVHARFYDDIIDHVMEHGEGRSLDVVLERTFGVRA